MKIVYAKDWIRTGGGGDFPPGSHWPADDPYVVAHRESFSADPRFHLAFTEPQDWYLDPALSEPTVETATAAPGERRNTRRS